MFQGRGAAESPGTGTALGDILEPAWSGPGADLIPASDVLAAGGINHMSMGVMAPDSTGDSSKEQPAAMLEAFLKMNANGGQYTINVQGGSPIVIEQACYAAPSASGFFFVSSSDVGNQPGQVAPQTALWSAAMMAPHPRVFIRSPSHTRGVASQYDAGQDANAIGGGFPGVNVWVVNSAPEYSVWVLIIDGAAHTVIFPHPAGSDIRRPRDAWAQVVVPELQRAVGQSNAFELKRDAGAGTLVSRGWLSRLNFTQYARFSGFDSGTSVSLLYVPS